MQPSRRNAACLTKATQNHSLQQKENQPKGTTISCNEQVKNELHFQYKNKPQFPIMHKFGNCSLSANYRKNKLLYQEKSKWCFLISSDNRKLTEHSSKLAGSELRCITKEKTEASTLF